MLRQEQILRLWGGNMITSMGFARQASTRAGNDSPSGREKVLSEQDKTLVLATESAERKLVRGWMTDLGFACFDTANPALAFSLIQRRRFCCVVTDVGPRCPSGYDFALRAMEYPRLIPCVCLADGLPSEKRQKQSILSRASFVLRPLDYNEFIHALKLTREHMNMEGGTNNDARTMARKNTS